MDVLQDRVLGCLWGGVLGDVIGAHLQFDFQITTAKIKESFSIVGGGKHNLERGQPTDDSQLNFSIMRALVRNKGVLNLNEIAMEMGKWYLSCPIDIGNTLRNSVPKACNMKVHQAHLCRKGAKEKSQQSQSNGSLMCISSLGVYLRALPPEQLRVAVREYTILIHPHSLVVESNTFYCLLLQYLLTHCEEEGRNLSAFHYAISNMGHMSEEFAKWVSCIQRSLTDFDYLLQQVPPKGGWVRVALSYAIYYLLMCPKFSFRQTIEHIVALKGDTDTNACIMGALVGAYYGFTDMHMEEQIQKISSWRPNKKMRPQWMVPGITIPNSYKTLIDNAPTKLILIGRQNQ